ncbi:efflux RND transporter periplasmic adaptor subunit [Gimesia panareensis]|uniref:efflux RND transporter periplasmic adaptor subunit n=1 Tax=Gimesia panareensis TaxID=2527978 RepID=UPI00118C3D49|nr:HlyD family efflux transporter periplasmic adaptor subunit [Gimesia panareensis]QDU51618.1 macrolide transporter subunit MacA [Gimesia panareensis]
MSPESTQPKHHPHVRVLQNRGRRQRSLHKSLLRSTLSAHDLDTLLNSLIEELTQHCQPALILYDSRSETSGLPPGRILYQQSTTAPDAALLSQLQQVCAKCMQSKEVEIQPYIDIQYTLYAAPVTVRGQEPHALGIVFPTTKSTEPCSLLLQTLVSHIVLWHVLSDGLQSEQHARDAAAIVELLSNMTQVNSLSEATRQAADELAAYLGCRQIAIGINDAPNSRCRLSALSDTHDFDKASKSVELIETAMNEVVRQQVTGTWTSQDNSPGSGSLSLQSVCEQQNATSAICVPLIRSDHEPQGVICAVNIPPDSLDKTRHLLEAAATPLANKLAAAQQRTSITRNWNLLLWKLFRSKARMAGLTLCLLLSALLFLPWPYTVVCDCQLEPVSQRFVVAPFEGSLETMLVEPGDLVHKGDVLARMDPRELRWKRSSLVADQNQALKRRDSAQAARDYTNQQLSKLEAERLGLEIELIDHRIENLEIKSPVEGIVVAGSLNWSEGAPLEIGEALFEIAPLDKMVVEVAVPDSEISHIREGQQVLVRLEALPDSEQTLSLQRIHPRAEIRDDANIFVAEAALDNSSRLLRPGMKGRASIQTPSQPVYWILFHKPWNFLRKYLF